MQITRQYESELGLTFLQLAIVNTISFHQGGTLKQVSEQLSLSKSTASTQVDQLVVKGIIHRETSKTDRRETMLSLTKQGTEAAKKKHHDFTILPSDHRPTRNKRPRGCPKPHRNTRAITRTTTKPKRREKIMAILTTIFILIVALLHFYIMYFEMFAFTKPRTLKTFNMTKEKAENGKELAANQGLYNGFLAAGLVWSLLYPDTTIGLQIALFFPKLHRNRSTLRSGHRIQTHLFCTRNTRHHRFNPNTHHNMSNKNDIKPHVVFRATN